MDDSSILHRISELVDEEHKLERNTDRDAFDETIRDRLRDLEVELDQCWDLLRQRRARRNQNRDPDEATIRPPDVVENYRQ